MTRPKHTAPRSGTAHRLAPGDTVPPRELTTIRSKPIQIPASDALTHLQFRRFAACPICNVHLKSVVRRHDEITAAGVREVVVFHSSVEAMLPHQGELPFEAIADPEKKLYAEFGVESSIRAVMHPKAWSAPLNRGAYEVAARERRATGKWLVGSRGESVLGLPADFLINPKGRVLAAKYGKHASDQWSVDDLLRIARTQSAK